MFNKVLIANRGEIACRIIKTCDRLGIKTVAVYSSADKDALFVQQAQEAYWIGEPPAKESYLNIDKIIAVAKKANVCAVHPGYGFLSENVAFAKRLEEEGITFIGPNIEAIDIMGSKSHAKHTMEKANVPVTPGYHGKAQDNQTLLKEAERIGFPVLIKAASGGGGKGMRVVKDKNSFLSELDSAKREAKKSFSDDTMLLETYLATPRHIEVQLFADKQGNVVHLFERECSIQRRHQKIIEEAPATNISQTVKDKMYQAAIDAAKAVNYIGAGTIEFLLEGDKFYFMEMNTRLQVEHPVTEMITGLDLVEWQLRIANNEPLPLEQHDISSFGHAIEVRLYAEDTQNQFLPQTGTVKDCHWPLVRVDTGISKGSEIGIHYDPMIAKIITHGASRIDAITAMQQALRETHLTGITHNRSFLAQILSSESFRNATIDTNYLTHFPPKETKSPELDAMAAALFPLLEESKDVSPWDELTSWQMNLPPQSTHAFIIHDEMKTLIVERMDESTYQVDIEGNFTCLKAYREDNHLILEVQGQKHPYAVYEHDTYIDLIKPCAQTRAYFPKGDFDSTEAVKGELTAPMPGNIVAILCNKQDTVDKGQTLMIIEAMKMEHSIHAPSAATVKDIFFKVGAQVNEGDELLALEHVS